MITRTNGPNTLTFTDAALSYDSRKSGLGIALHFGIRFANGESTKVLTPLHELAKLSFFKVESDR